MSLVNHAKRELDLIGMKGYPQEDYDGALRECILSIIEIFAEQGHSGFSANIVTNIVEKLMRYEPLSPLTGEDDEWMHVGGLLGSGEDTYQNIRCSHVFKEGDNAYDIQGKVFWEWVEGDDGERFKMNFTNFESRVPVTFPYVPTIEYVERVTNE